MNRLADSRIIGVWALALLIGCRFVVPGPAAAQEVSDAELVTSAASGIVEEDLGFELEALLAKAEEVFQSADQPSSIPLFSEAILLVEGRLAADEGSEELEELLIRSLFFRAEASFNLGQREAAEQDLERILRRRPGFRADPSLVSRKLRQTLDRLRDTMVGELELVLEPADAQVLVDGEPVEPGAPTVPLLAGPHGLAVERPGYEPQRLEIELSAGEVQRHEIVLLRSSAVIRLTVRPSGLTVLVDGGPASSSESTPMVTATGLDSTELTIWGLRPGRRVLDIGKSGFRTTRLEVDLAELEDYGLPPVGLEPTRGTVLLDGVPAEARLLVNGEPRSRSTSLTGRVELVLPPGEHRIRVTAGPLGEFERRLTLADRETVEIGVELEPSLVFLGVLGGDRSAARDLSIRLERLFGDLDGWALLDRSNGGANILLDAGIDTLRLRGLTSGQVAVADEPDWPGLRGALDREVRGSLYVLAVLTDDLFATHADLWLWAAEPGPARPRRLRLSLEDADELASLGTRLEVPTILRIPWLGARFGDSSTVGGPIVIGLTPDGPADEAGLQLGDPILAVAGVAVASADELRERVSASGGGELSLEIDSAGGVRQLVVRAGTSHRAISLTDPDLLDPAVSALLAREEAGPGKQAPLWLLRLDRALLHMRAGEWRQAVRVLREIEAPTGPGLGQASVDYWLAVALLEADPAAYQETALGLFARAAEVEGARLQHDDGPLVVTRARARIEDQKR